VQSGFRDQPVDVSIQVAAAADHILNGIQPVLPDRGPGIIAPAMFEKEKLPG
jgi:hypothetical protein